MAAQYGQYDTQSLLRSLGIERYEFSEYREKGLCVARLTCHRTGRRWIANGLDEEHARRNLIYWMEHDQQSTAAGPVSTTDPAIYEWM